MQLGWLFLLLQLLQFGFNMGLFGKLLSATVKVALTPVAVVTDAVSVTQGDAPLATASLVVSATGDVIDGAIDLTNLDL